MRRSLALLLWLGLLVPSARAEVVVRIAGEQVDVTATAAPLKDVLDRLAEQTGMEIVYEGTPPSQRITVTLQGRSASEIVQGILEGQGQNYALVADPTGRRVQTLILAGPAGKGTSAGSGSPAPAPRARRPVIPAPGGRPEMLDPSYGMDEEDPFEDPDFMDPTLEEPPEEDPAGLPSPVPGMGALPFPGGQPQIFPASPFAPQPFGASPPSAPAPTTPPPPGSQAPPE